MQLIHLGVFCILLLPHFNDALESLENPNFPVQFPWIDNFPYLRKYPEYLTLTSTIYLDPSWINSEDSSFQPLTEVFNVVKEANRALKHHTLITKINLRIHKIVLSDVALVPTGADILKFQDLIEKHLPRDMSNHPDDHRAHIFLTTADSDIIGRGN